MVAVLFAMPNSVYHRYSCDVYDKVRDARVEPADMPAMPYRIGEPEFVVGTSRQRRNRREIPKSQREATPLALAEWLLAVAELAGRREAA